MNAVVAPADTARIVPTLDAVCDWLCKRIATSLGIHASQIDPDITFDRYGLDSVHAVEVTADLGASLGLGELSPTLLYDYPTINQLTAHVTALAQQQ